MQSDKKLLKDFAYEVVDDSVKLEDVVEKYVKYTAEGKKMSQFVLNSIKDEYKKTPGQIVVYTPEEGNKKGTKFKMDLKEKEKLYYIKFNKNLILPFFVDNDSKIVVLLYITKGDGGTLSNARSDE
ncbi:hypothetical protein [Flavobacterium hiemivividum]|uniref:DUF3887 domain-containing protein n=1 Tax=Flavobacterium hiemivividum TaxID=2541734 RepID=A0A4V2Z1X6_9FLAO|nr:hypothetical protein [Flavobacterium hiemivividum]TDE06658.1 hypothetical protein E0F98_03320 [Flavobacterium hiemivividum]